MTEYPFRLILSGPFPEQLSDEELLNVTDALGTAGCDDCSVSVHGRGLELEFDRAHHTLQEALASAIHDVESAGYIVESIQMDRNAVLPVGSS